MKGSMPYLVWADWGFILVGAVVGVISMEFNSTVLAWMGGGLFGLGIGLLGYDLKGNSK